MQAEDDNDVQAANLARAEQVAEMAEFDENFSSQISLNSKEVRPEAECSKAMAEFARIEEQLNGVERYAMKYLEEENAEFAAAQLRLAEENIELAKKDWELSHLQSLREEEERLAEVEVQDVMLTYDRPETSNKVILRRKPSTGTWEICSPSSNHDPLCDEESTSENDLTREPRRDQFNKQENGREGFGEGPRHSQRSCDLKLGHKAAHRKPSSNLSVSTNPDGGSAVPATRTSSTELQPKRAARYHSDGSDYELLDSDYRDLKGEHRTPPVSRRRVQETVQKLPDTLSLSNHLADAHCIGSRTRRKTQHTNDRVKSPSRKHPTRHKLPGLNH